MRWWRKGSSNQSPDWERENTDLSSDGIDRMARMFSIQPAPENDVKRPLLFVFANMKGYQICIE